MTSRHAVIQAITFLSLIVVLLPAVKSLADQKKHQVAHWRLVKNSSQAAGTVVDATGNEHNGVIIGRPSWRQYALGLDGHPLVFDGHQTRVLIADRRTFWFRDGFTLEAYICLDRYPSPSAEMAHIVFRGDDRLGLDPWFLSVTDRGRLRFLIADETNHASVLLSDDAIPMGTLLHVAATWDRKSGAQRLFVNHRLIAQTKTAIVPIASLPGPSPAIGIGNRQGASNQGFAGTIHDVRISSRALRPSQFQRPTRELREDDRKSASKATTRQIGGLTFFHPIDVDRLARGATVPLGQGHHEFIDVRDPLVGRFYTKRDPYQGAVRFRVEKDQLVYAAFYGSDWGQGGNDSGRWKYEIVSPDQLRAMGWNKVGSMRVRHSNPQFPEEPAWILYVRACRRGERFTLRNHKYQAPVLIWGNVVNEMLTIGATMIRRNGIMRHLVFANSQVKDDDLQILETFAGLESLTLIGCSAVSDETFRRLGKLRQLRSLNLSPSRVSDRSAAEISRLAKLEVLSLNGTAITDAGIRRFAPLSRLKVLHLHQTAITDQALTTIAGLKQLEILDLGKTRITDNGLEKLSALRNLRELHLKETAVTDKGRSAFRSALPQCRVFFQ